MRVENAIFLSIFIYSVASKRYNFTDDFRFGAATASYQIEGAWNVDGRLPSIWDTAVHKNPSNVIDGATGDDAGMSYFKYQDDIDALEALNFTVYRFSIAWTRVLTQQNAVNQAGIDYYSKLIDGLLAKNIEPMATMYHWDLPQYLQDLGGWTNPIIIKYFVIYANLLFKSFGDRVKEWITFNEPTAFCDQGYSSGSHAPEIKTTRQIGGYLCSHHVLLAHAAAYHLYKEKYRANQGGKVGICFAASFRYPANASVTQATVEKSMQFTLGRYANPIFSRDGDYPKVVRDAIDAKSKDEGRRWSRLPKFTAEQIEQVKGSADFLALNYYTSTLVMPFSLIGRDPQSSDTEIQNYVSSSWKRSASSWLYQVPQGFYDLLVWIKESYDNPLIFVTENGWSDEPMTLADDDRIEYLERHLAMMSRAIDDGCNVKAYTVWSLIDNFEWMRGFSERFGIFAINFTDPDRQRIPKKSAGFFKNLTLNRFIDVDDF